MPTTAVLLCMLLSGASPADANSALQQYLQSVEADFSEEHQMLGMTFHSPGYHSQVAEGAWVHPTRQNLNYAASLLERNAPGDSERAGNVIRKVLSLQDTDPSHETYGIWPWLMEEPLEKMAPPDWNWADFCGAAIALMLADYPSRLPKDVWESMRTSLAHAAAAIRRRDVKPSYTNICIMGAGVCAVAGELLGDGDLVRYGRGRLQRTVEHARFHGGFNEYNSPTYTMVALWECERTLHLVNDPETREAAETLRQIAWQTIAGSFHPATGQWAGPHSRAYSDLLAPNVIDYLAEQTGVQIAPHPAMVEEAEVSNVQLFEHLPCPEQLQSRFAALPDESIVLSRTFNRREDPATSTVGTTWLSQVACLGSVNRSEFWTQRRVLIGYWATDQDPAVVLRLRFLHDGQDFASMGAATHQQEHRALSVLYPIRNRGDWHVSLDRPKDGIFQASDFRLCYELTGEGVQVEQEGENRFSLSAGDYRAVVTVAACEFAGELVHWRTVQEEGRAAVEGICYHGSQKPFNFHTFSDLAVAVGVEVLRRDQSASDHVPVLNRESSGTVAATWKAGRGLRVAVDVSK